MQFGRYPMVERGGLRALMRLLLVLGFRGFISFIACGSLGSECDAWRTGVALGGPGIGIAIRDAALIRRARLTAIHFQKSCCRSGIGRNIILGSRRTSDISIT